MLGELCLATVWPLDIDLVVPEVFVIKNFAGNANGVVICVELALDGGAIQIGLGNFGNMLRRKFTVFCAKIFSQFAIQQISVDKLHFAFAVFRLVIVQQPYVGRNARVVEQVVRELDDGFQHGFDDVAADVAFAAARIAREQAGTVMNGRNAAAKRAYLRRLHFADHFHQEQQLAIAGAWGGVYDFLIVPIVGKLDLEARVDHVIAVFDVLQLRFPALAVWRVKA